MNTVKLHAKAFFHFPEHSHLHTHTHARARVRFSEFSNLFIHLIALTESPLGEAASAAAAAGGRDLLSLAL